VFPSIAGSFAVVLVIALTRLVAFAIDDGERWRRFLILVLLVMAAAAVWWLLADGGVHVLLHDFGGLPMAPDRVSTR
jgi:uncharacterized membrane protein YqjE